MSPVWNPGGGSGGGGIDDPTWIALASLGVNVVVLGAPFIGVAECALWGSLLLFRGLLGCDANGTGFRMFNLPVGIPHPTEVRRINVQTGSTADVGLNINADGTVTLAGNSGTFVVLDDKSLSWEY